MNNTDKPLRVILNIDSGETDARVEIFAREYTEQLRRIELIAESGTEFRHLIGMTGSGHELIAVENISVFFTRNKRVWARTNSRDFQLRQRLSELEQRLDTKQFVRISQSEIVNLRFVQSLDFSIAGMISLRLTDGTTCYVSRRSISNFKKQLGL